MVEGRSGRACNWHRCRPFALLASAVFILVALLTPRGRSLLEAAFLYSERQVITFASWGAHGPPPPLPPSVSPPPAFAAVVAPASYASVALAGPLSPSGRESQELLRQRIQMRQMQRMGKDLTQLMKRLMHPQLEPPQLDVADFASALAASDPFDTLLPLGKVSTPAFALSAGVARDVARQPSFALGARGVAPAAAHNLTFDNDDDDDDDGYSADEFTNDDDEYAQPTVLTVRFTASNKVGSDA